MSDVSELETETEVYIGAMTDHCKRLGDVTKAYAAQVKMERLGKVEVPMMEQQAAQHYRVMWAHTLVLRSLILKGLSGDMVAGGVSGLENMTHEQAMELVG